MNPSDKEKPEPGSRAIDGLPRGFPVALQGFTTLQVFEETSGCLHPLFEACSSFWRSMYGSPPGPDTATLEFADLPPGKELADNHTFGVVDSEGEIVAMLGSLRGFPTPETWSIGLLMVAPEFRSVGIGGALYRAFETWVVGQGARVVRVVVLRSNPAAQQFWRKAGFLRSGTVLGKRYGRLAHDVDILERKVGG